jgi:hypothetical protein
VVFTLVQKIWPNLIFTLPENLGEWYLHVVQKIWTGCILTLPGNLKVRYYIVPENLDQLYFHASRKSGILVLQWSRKSGPLVFSRFQKIWVIGIHTGPEKFKDIFHVTRNSGCVVFTRSPENLDQLFFYDYVPRKSGGVVFTLVQLYFHAHRKSVYKNGCFHQSGKSGGVEFN